MRRDVDLPRPRNEGQDKASLLRARAALLVRPTSAGPGHGSRSILRVHEPC